MSIENELILILLIITILLFWLWRRAASKLTDIKFQKHSLSSKYGKMTEQFMPFLNHYPYNPQNFRFLGTPIDGIQFEEDRIILMEFKTANSHLTPRQLAIKELAQNKRVTFEEIRLN